MFRVSADGQHVDTLGLYPGAQGIMESRLDGRQKRLHPLPFGLTTQVAAADSVIYVGSIDAWVIEVLDSNGTLRRSIRRTIGRSSVTPDMVERYRRAQLASLPTDSARQDMERFLATVDHPERLPAYGELRVADGGSLWVQDFLVTPEDSNRWTVFEPSGRVAARVSLPPGLMVDQIGSDFVLGRARDALDVERVELFRLSRE